MGIGEERTERQVKSQFTAVSATVGGNERLWFIPDLPGQGPRAFKICFPERGWSWTANNATGLSPTKSFPTLYNYDKKKETQNAYGKRRKFIYKYNDEFIKKIIDETQMIYF